MRILGVLRHFSVNFGQRALKIYDLYDAYVLEQERGSEPKSLYHSVNTKADGERAGGDCCWRRNFVGF